MKRRVTDEGAVNGPVPHEFGIRPEHPWQAQEAEASLSGAILVTEELGETTIVHLDVGGSPVAAKLPGEVRLRRGIPCT
ncbi:MAG: hypothetical protein H7Y08_07370 [Rhizobiaceae bacterium]|nr:hypothetical protein [Rhizobiaceae bacterium]